MARNTLRPLLPGERRANADGSYSTELLTTWQLPDGRWVNVPSLWMGPDGPVQFDEGDEQGILGTMGALEAARGGGEQFRRYPSVEMAEDAARNKSNSGGVGNAMVGLLSGALMGPEQRLRMPQAPAAQMPAPMQQQASQGGILSMINPNIGQNPLYQRFDQNRDVLTNMLLGGVGAESPLERMRGMAGGALQGRDTSRLLGMEREKQEKEQRAINQTIQALSQKRPELVPWVQSGAISPGDAFNAVFGNSQKGTDDIQEYQFAVQQGFQGTFRDWQLDSKKAGASQVNNFLGGTDKFREKIDANMGDLFTGLVDSGWQADRSLIQINRMDELLSQVPTGAGAAFKQIAGNFGIASESLSEIQAAQAIINQLVPQQRPAGSGPMSDADLELFKQSLPRIINQPGGNKMIIDTMRGIAEYTAAQGKIAQMVTAGQVTPEQGLQMLNQLPNPLEQIRTSAVGDNPSAAYKKRYGLE